MEVVINNEFGGFGLSYEGTMRYAELKGITLYAFVNKKDERGKLDFDKLHPYDPNVDGRPPLDLIYYYTSRSKKDDTFFWSHDIERNDPALIQTVKELKEKSYGSCAKLKIVKIPKDIKWHIEEYDGNEWVTEDHRTWE